MAGPRALAKPKPHGAGRIARAAAAFTSVFFIDFCNLVYQCGCRSLWAGADAACNIHTHGGPALSLVQYRQRPAAS